MKRAGWRMRGLMAVLAMPLLLCSCASVDLVTGRKVNNLYDVQDDIQMGREGIKDFVAKMRTEGVPVNRDKAKVIELKAIVARIVDASGVTNFPYDVTLFTTNIVNAMALPGGQMVVFTGLWDPEEGLVQESDVDQLAAVIGHEWAHVTCRHSTEELTRQLPLDLILGGAAIYAEIKDDEEVASVAEAAFILYQGLLIPRYSRTDEREADRIGMMYMAKAGYDPHGAVRLWQHVSEREGDDWPILSIFSTHPANSDRLADLQKHLPEAMVDYERARRRVPAGTAPQL